MKLLRQLARILFGLTFMFSGFVKGIDPLGSSYKFTDYFHAMGLDSLVTLALPLALLLSFAEFMIGVAFVFNWWMKVFAWLGLLFMAFFLPLTFWIAIENPVTDCGCFGDALVISNWETFYKNILLSAIAVMAFIYRDEKGNPRSYNIRAGLSLATGLIYIVLVNYSYNHLPLIDFRPYKVGVNMPEGMSIPDDAPKEIYENTFFYKNKNTGQIETFTEENYPWQDTLNWEYHDMESVLVQEGYEPPIHDFRIETMDGEDISDSFLYDENFVFILISKDLNEANSSVIEKIKLLSDWASEKGFPFIGLTASIPEEYMEYMEENQLGFEFFNCDEITLKTMIRSNPGLMVIKDGTILGKWHFNDFPSPEEFEKKFMSSN